MPIFKINNLEVESVNVSSADIADAGAAFPAFAQAETAAAQAALLPVLPTAGGTISGNLTVQGSTTLGDAVGDILTVSGSIVAAQATSESATDVANIGTLDARYPRELVDGLYRLPLNDGYRLTNASGAVSDSNGHYSLQTTASTNSSAAGIRWTSSRLPTSTAAVPYYGLNTLGIVFTARPEGQFTGNEPSMIMTFGRAGFSLPLAAPSAVGTIQASLTVTAPGIFTGVVSAYGAGGLVTGAGGVVNLSVGFSAVNSPGMQFALLVSPAGVVSLYVRHAGYGQRAFGAWALVDSVAGGPASSAGVAAISNYVGIAFQNPAASAVAANRNCVVWDVRSVVNPRIPE